MRASVLSASLAMLGRLMWGSLVSSSLGCFDISLPGVFFPHGWSAIEQYGSLSSDTI